MSRSLSYRRRLGYKSGSGAMSEGAQAFRDGKTYADCPYHDARASRGKAHAWRKGFNNARTQTAK